MKYDPAIPRRRFLRISSCVAVAALAGCYRAPARPLRVGTNVAWLPQLLPYLARSLGYFDDSTIRLLEYPSNPEAMRDYRSGVLDVLVTGVANTLPRLEADAGERIVFIMSRSGDVAVLAQAGIHSMAELRGRKIGVNPNPFGAHMLSRALESAGMTRADLTVVPVETPDWVRAFEEKRVDAVIAYEPARTRILTQGGIEIFSSARISGEYMATVLVHERTRRECAPALRAFIAAILRASPQFKRDSAASASRLFSYTKFSEEEFKRAAEPITFFNLEENRAMLSGRDPVLNDALEVLRRDLVSNKMIAGSADPKLLLDPSFLP